MCCVGMRTLEHSGSSVVVMSTSGGDTAEGQTSVRLNNYTFTAYRYRLYVQDSSVQGQTTQPRHATQVRDSQTIKGRGAHPHI